ncbi:hypothetical protein TRFO_20427 [Tritrichomonas foetus]|uniref:N-acetylgalactosaminide beta-1,3-galactosyltransferase n=1 Tax=Tritrichomonas foetus TaxID=1144522 RepID=A0A1J4KGM5_9EUKA|nr:hypothetical protein TRFO_20427 [Tritrichomonas foetus]|eukprot:OHT10371.1 hypothetical protein TRFO_20427 [Tritrichomonas foetus]
MKNSDLKIARYLFCYTIFISILSILMFLKMNPIGDVVFKRKAEQTFSGNTKSYSNECPKCSECKNVADSENQINDKNPKKDLPKQNDNNKDDDVVPKMGKKPLCVIFLHTCGATFDRLVTMKKTWAYSKLVDHKQFIIEAVISSPVKRWTPFHQLAVGCNDERIFTTCRFQNAYEKFLEKYPNTPWLFTADDDTWIDLDNLWIYLNNLMEIHNPMTDIVVKGHANFEGKEKKLYFLHGGSGWLTSNAYLRFAMKNNINLKDLQPYSRYRQPDTSQSIVLRKLYNDTSDWDEYHIQGFHCRHCETKKTLNNNWKTVPECEEGRKYGRLNDIISFHTISLNEDNLKLAENIKNAPPDILYHRIDRTQEMTICRKTKESITVESYSLKAMKAKEKIITEKDVKLPLYVLPDVEDESDTR